MSLEFACGASSSGCTCDVGFILLYRCSPSKLRLLGVLLLQCVLLEFSSQIGSKVVLFAWEVKSHPIASCRHMPIIVLKALSGINAFISDFSSLRASCSVLVDD